MTTPTITLPYSLDNEDILIALSNDAKTGRTSIYWCRVDSPNWTLLKEVETPRLLDYEAEE